MQAQMLLAWMFSIGLALIIVGLSVWSVAMALVFSGVTLVLVAAFVYFDKLISDTKKSGETETE